EQTRRGARFSIVSGARRIAIAIVTRTAATTTYARRRGQGHGTCLDGRGVRRTRHHERAARRAPTAPRATRRAAHSRPLDPNEAAAVDAGLRYVRDDAPGLRRVGTPPRFAYVDPEGRRVHDAATLARIRAIAIPPAWTDVWICAAPQGHIQATGRDSRGRKQYRYHAGWRAHRD